MRTFKILVPLALSALAISAQEPSNTVTVDIGPTIIGVGVGIALDAALKDTKADAGGFGFGLQYERQLFPQLSVAGRFAYLGFDAGFAEKKQNAKAELESSIYSYSIEAHARTYPFGGSFFLDGSLGYASLSSVEEGEVWVTENSVPKIYSIDIDASRNYFKYGVKLGWRVDFGAPGGFIFEHGLGYYFCSTSSKTLSKQIIDGFKKKYPDVAEDPEIGEFDDASKILEDFIFVGGPRYTFAFGWRF